MENNVRPNQPKIPGDTPFPWTPPSNWLQAFEHIQEVLCKEFSMEIYNRLIVIGMVTWPDIFTWDVVKVGKGYVTRIQYLSEEI